MLAELGIETPAAESNAKAEPKGAPPAQIKLPLAGLGMRKVTHCSAGLSSLAAGWTCIAQLTLQSLPQTKKGEGMGGKV